MGINSAFFLIIEYLKCGEYFFKILEEKYHIKNESMLRARRINLIPKEGKIEDVYFQFHGIGIYFEVENDNIDIDFGPDGRFDGFDEGRLYDFLLNRPKKYFDIKTKNDFRNQFNELIICSLIFNPAWKPSEHLYYLTQLGEEVRKKYHC